MVKLKSFFANQLYNEIFSQLPAKTQTEIIDELKDKNYLLEKKLNHKIKQLKEKIHDISLDKGYEKHIKIGNNYFNYNQLIKSRTF